MRRLLQYPGGSLRRCSPVTTSRLRAPRSARRGLRWKPKVEERNRCRGVSACRGESVTGKDGVEANSRHRCTETNRRGSREHTEDGRSPIAEQPATGLHGLTGRPPAGSRRTQNERCTTALCPRFRLTGTSFCSGVAHGSLYAAATVATEGNVYRVGHAGGQRSTVGSRLPLSRTRCPMICST